MDTSNKKGETVTLTLSVDDGAIALWHLRIRRCVINDVACPSSKQTADELALGRVINTLDYALACQGVK